MLDEDDELDDKELLDEELLLDPASVYSINAHRVERRIVAIYTYSNLWSHPESTHTGVDS